MHWMYKHLHKFPSPQLTRGHEPEGNHSSLLSPASVPSKVTPGGMSLQGPYHMPKGKATLSRGSLKSGEAPIHCLQLKNLVCPVCFISTPQSCLKRRRERMLVCEHPSQHCHFLARVAPHPAPQLLIVGTTIQGRRQQPYVDM